MTQSVDYRKWDELAALTEAEEVHQQELTRMKNRDQYLKEQQERVKEYESKQQSINQSINQSADQSTSQSATPHLHTFSRRTRTCGCGFTNIDDLKRYTEESKNKPKLSIESKNALKFDALYAVREHGKILASTNQWNDAYTVYERGALIISAMFELEDDSQAEADELELMFTLNMALCKQHLDDPHAVIDLCKQALQYDESNDQQPSIHRIKAYNRMAQAYVNIGEYALADQAIEKVLAVEPENVIAKQVRRARIKNQQQDRQQRLKYEDKMREKLKSTSTD